MARVRLGELLVRAGLINEGDLRVALAQQKQHGGRLGEHLVRVNLLTEETLARVLAQQMGLQFADVTEVPPPGIARLIPDRVAARLQMLPLAFDNRTGVLAVAVSDPLDEAGLTEVAKATNKQVVAQVAPANQLRRAIERAYFGVEVDTDGPKEFQLVDIHGRGKTVRVHEDHELPELGTGEIVPLTEADLAAGPSNQALPPLLPQSRPPPMRIAPLPPGSRPPPPPPTPRPQTQPPGVKHPSFPPKSPPVAKTPSLPPMQAPEPWPPLPTLPGPQAAGHSDAGEEALRLCWALADLLIDRGYFTRADLMRVLRGK